VSDVLKSTQRTLLIYAYEIKADCLIELVRQAHDRGVAVKMMYDRGGTHAAVVALSIPVAYGRFVECI
jgi:hypothetical protein